MNRIKISLQIELESSDINLHFHPSDNKSAVDLVQLMEAFAAVLKGKSQNSQ